MKLLKRSLVALLASGLVAMTGTTSASAATGDCASGYACVWEHPQFGGRYFGTAKSKAALTSLINVASSAAANGASCRYTRFYDDRTLNNEPSGSYFTLYSKQLMGSNYRDPDLRNGAGLDGAGRNFDDTIEGVWFTGC
ncbi:peptidase inhibitor family I36 protein [Sanguibacter suaedae]|uniref:Peptidase inhibitor family I36 protein n=1 Tax=Sanguibacter suaedae TaxID=2795737 RepID=A0A934MBV6_9MICO|nr:peptidase inhibitor family I36 protein [Sanguibacter suaedae]MBI9115721.1 peptidase inhibitor family I36 protein [Sanguibacter suaedae]